MNQKFFRLSATLILVTTLLGASGFGDTISFTYTSTSLDPVSGNGSFSFIGPSTNISLSQLTQFSFTDIITDRELPSDSATFSYGLSDLTSFSATLTASDDLSALALITSLQQPSSECAGCAFNSEDFEVLSLAPGGAQTIALAPPLVTTSIGQVTAPEPSNIALLGAGLLCLLRVRRKVSPT